MPTKVLTAFWGRPIHVEAGVELPHPPLFLLVVACRFRAGRDVAHRTQLSATPSHNRKHLIPKQVVKSNTHLTAPPPSTATPPPLQN